jgi:hypothetical protein
MATYYAADLTHENVQDAISSCAAGDTLVLPSGSATWDLRVTCHVGINIVGPGTGSCFIWSTTATNGSGAKAPCFLVTLTVATQHFDLRDITFDGTLVSYDGIIKISGLTSDTFYVHHCKFQNLTHRTLSPINIYGVIASNTFEAGGGTEAQGVSVFGDLSLGTTSWGRGLTLGTKNAVYIEDNLFDFDVDNDGALDAYGGARYVFRYNTLYNTHLGHHGADSGGYHSVYSWEVYNNTIISSVDLGGKWFGSRGGTGVVYNNMATADGTEQAVLSNYRSDAAYAPWGICNGLNPIDGNDDSSGYPCFEQNGMTGADGTTPAPIYCWDNIVNSVTGTMVVTDDVTATDGSGNYMVDLHIQENRDFYNSTSPTYIPYTYPHPLRGQITDVAQRFAFVLL